MSLRNKMSRAAAVYREEGWSGVGTRLRQLWSALWGYRSYSLYVLSIRPGLTLWPQRVDGLIGHLRRRYQIEWSNENFPDFIPEYEQLRDDLSPDDARDWFRAGHRTIMISDRGSMVGDCWIALDHYPLPSECPPLVEWLDRMGYAYSYMGYVRPSHRGLGVFPLLLAEQVEYAGQHGCHGLMGAVLPRSRSSAESLETMGFERAGQIKIWKILGKEVTKFTIQNDWETSTSDD